MRRKPSEILKEALVLPPDVRASIADSLLESLDQEVEAGASEEWEREIQKRTAEVGSGAVKTISWSDARARLMSRLHDNR
jgi:putative addiction module component (TIGR02574 family)